MFHFYLYRITNTINNKFYIGVRKSKVSPDKDKYFGSGKRLRDSIKCYGKSSFAKEILETFSDESSMYLREAEIVNNEFLLRNDVYNLALGGSGGDHWSYLPERGEIIAQTTATLQHQMAAMTKEDRSKKFGNFGEKNSMFGKKHGEDALRKMAEANCIYSYRLIDPLGTTHFTNNLSHFCKNHNINRDILLKSIGTGRVAKPRNFGFASRMNTIGWSIFID